MPEKGVQWGKYLRVRVRVNATKKLVRGKNVTIKGEEGNHRRRRSQMGFFQIRTVT